MEWKGKQKEVEGRETARQRQKFSSTGTEPKRPQVLGIPREEELNSSRVSHTSAEYPITWTIFHCPNRHICRERNMNWGSLDYNSDKDDRQIHCSTILAPWPSFYLEVFSLCITTKNRPTNISHFSVCVKLLLPQYAVFIIGLLYYICRGYLKKVLFRFCIWCEARKIHTMQSGVKRSLN